MAESTQNSNPNSRLNRSTGRPRKAEADKYIRFVGIKFTRAEYDVLQQQAQVLGISVSEYCRKAIFATEITRPFTEEELDLKRKLVGMANNLNQLAHQANAAGFQTAEADCKHLLSEIKKELEIFRR